MRINFEKLLKMTGILCIVALIYLSVNQCEITLTLQNNLAKEEFQRQNLKERLNKITVNTLDEKIEKLKESSSEIKETLNAVDDFITVQDNFNQTQINFNEKIVNYSLKEHQKPSYEYLKSITVVIHGTMPYYNEETGNQEELEWMGTGVIIKMTENSTYILTNNHVAPAGLNINIYVENDIKNDLIRAKVIKNDIKNDMSLIIIPKKLINKSVIRGIGKHPEVQEKVYLVGHHLGDKYTYGEGVVAGISEENNFLVIQLPVLFGDSGSGLINQNGELVGLIHAVKSFPVFFFGIADGSHGICVPIKIVKDFLKGVI